MTTHRLATISAACVLALVACESDGGEQLGSMTNGAASAPPASAWSYEGDTGPTHWSVLDRDYAVCASSARQSPIALQTPRTAEDLPDLEADYRETGLSIVNNGHTIQFNCDPGSRARVGGVEYELRQFHFHAHSEHSIDGMFSPMELHLVHADAEGNLLAIGLLIEPGASNATLAGAGWDRLPRTSGETLVDPSRRFNARALLPDGPTYRYEGSLTVPPCSENVSWVVYQDLIELSNEQIAAFTSLHGDSARPLQPLGSRVVAFGD